MGAGARDPRDGRAARLVGPRPARRRSRRPGTWRWRPRARTMALAPLSSGTWTTTHRRLRSSTITSNSSYPRPRGADGAAATAQDAVTDAVGDAAQLLVVLVNERTGVAGPIPTDGQPGQRVEGGEPGHAFAVENGGIRGPRYLDDTDPGDRDPNATSTRPRGSGPPRQLACLRRALRLGASVGQSGRALGAQRSDPLVRRGSTDALGFSSRRRRPAQDRHTRHQQLTTKDVETGLTMGHESLLAVRCFNTPTVIGGSHLSTTSLEMTTSSLAAAPPKPSSAVVDSGA